MIKAIVINGASSSGGTSLVNRFCSLANEDYRKIHIDEYLRKLPPGMWECCCDSDEGWAEIGMAFNEYLAELAQQHKRLIADAFYKLPPVIEHLFAALGRDRVFYVQLYCDLAELEHRELARGNRRNGLARSQFEHIYSFTGYMICR